MAVGTNSSYFFLLWKKRNGRKKSLFLILMELTLQIQQRFPTLSLHSALYTSKFYDCKCENFISKLMKDVPPIKDDFKTLWDSEITLNEIKTAPGIDGLSVELYINFWDLIQNLLFYMYKECISQREMSTTLKKVVISLVPKPDKDIILIFN